MSPHVERFRFNPVASRWVLAFVALFIAAAALIGSVNPEARGTDPAGVTVDAGSPAPTVDASRITGVPPSCPVVVQSPQPMFEGITT